MTPGQKSRELAAEVLKDDASLGTERTLIERERTAQERERTEQLRLQTQTTSQALERVSRVLDRSSPSDPKAHVLTEVQGELAASSEREMLIEPYRTELEKIPDPTMSRLLDRTRSQVVEMGKPLIRSAERLEIGEVSTKSPFVNLNRRTVENLSGNSVDPLPSMLRGSVTRFDKENGWGKFRNPEFVAPVSFVLPSAIRNRLRGDVIDAMKEDEVDLVFYYVRDKSGKVQYLILDNVLFDGC